MTRPTVRIDKPNQRDHLLAHLNDHLAIFTALPGVIGITLNGGLARGYGDHLSEVDITLYLESEVFAGWQCGNAPVGMGIQVIDGTLYDIKIADLTQENVDSWSPDTRWDASYAQVLYDPTGTIGTLLAQNEQYRPSPLDAASVMFSAWWHFQLAGDIWIYRDDPLQTHFVLNGAVTSLVKALFLANGEFIPHEKWLIHMSRTLEWTPDNWIARLTQVMCELLPESQHVRLRQQRVAALWQDVDRHIVSITDEQYPLNVMHRKFYDLLVMLVENQAVSTDEWRGIADLSLLNAAPFNLCVAVDHDTIMLDRARCAALSATDLYSWHYAIVRAVQARL